nr:hypothetical protein [Planococcus glaciei]
MKKTVSGLLAVSLLASAPWSSVLAEAPQTTYVNALEEKRRQFVQQRKL